MIRRMSNRELARGWTAWAEFWSARAYAMGRLREVGNKLRAPSLAAALTFWVQDHGLQKAEAEYARAQAETKTLGGLLTAARYELSQARARARACTPPPPPCATPLIATATRRAQ